jgi:hypothetical protein
MIDPDVEFFSTKEQKIVIIKELPKDLNHGGTPVTGEELQPWVAKVKARFGR